MTEYENEAPISGLTGLVRQVEPTEDLWAGIQLRLRPRRRHAGLPIWAGMALAASLLAAIVLPLRQVQPLQLAPIGVAMVPGPEQRVAYFTGQLRVVRGAETELLAALKFNPQSPALRRLLESTRERQRELRRLATSHV